jgi:D-sedoheptulose 7-phosphate isomerase
MTSFAAQYLAEVAAIAGELDTGVIDSMAEELARVRAAGGRLFILGVGGGAANATHAVNDFRKICDLESYTPTDNVSELSARINDEGWETAYSAWLRGSRLRREDAVLVFSVGGGSREHGISLSVVDAVELANEVGATVLGVVGRDGGSTAQFSDICLIVRPPDPNRLTPHVEEFQAVVWHLLVSHPALAMRSGTWESVSAPAARSDS